MIAGGLGVGPRPRVIASAVGPGLEAPGRRRSGASGPPGGRPRGRGLGGADRPRGVQGGGGAFGASRVNWARRRGLVADRLPAGRVSLRGVSGPVLPVGARIALGPGRRLPLGAGRASGLGVGTGGAAPAMIAGGLGVGPSSGGARVSGSGPRAVLRDRRGGSPRRPVGASGNGRGLPSVGGGLGGRRLRVGRCVRQATATFGFEADRRFLRPGTRTVATSGGRVANGCGGGQRLGPRRQPRAILSLTLLGWPRARARASGCALRGGPGVSGADRPRARARASRWPCAAFCPRARRGVSGAGRSKTAVSAGRSGKEGLWLALQRTFASRADRTDRPISRVQRNVGVGRQRPGEAHFSGTLYLGAGRGAGARWQAKVRAHYIPLVQGQAGQLVKIASP